MSEAGILSNRGDWYQTLVAMNWAITVLSDTEYQWLEIDSTTYLVDDVVIGKSDGSLICCQCKKNQADFSAWSIADLAGELDKAFRALTKNREVQVCFYSRSEFGALAKLKEYSALYSNEADYLANLTKEHTKTNSDLVTRIVDQALGLSVFEFLHRISFETDPDFDRMEILLRERLRQIANNSTVAFNALWVKLEKLGGRIDAGNQLASTQHRLTKENLVEILHQAGAMLVPVMSIKQVRSSFASTSAIGRSWHRDIAGQRIPSSLVNELLAAIQAGKHAVLLTGLPGSGKTCVMLGLQEALEQYTQERSDLVPLFIQSREFADLATAQERQSQGLSEKWVEQAARLSEDAHVVVVIDSLDVLSIAREHSVLTYFLAQIDQLLLLPKVTVITACRDFDRKYDRRIATRHWDLELQCLPLDWDAEIAPLLSRIGIDSTSIDAVTRELIRNPRELALFVELAQRGGSFNVVTSQALAQRYLDTIVQTDPALGDAAMQAIEALADEMLISRSLSIPRQHFHASQDILRRLHSLNVLQDIHDRRVTFGHQTLLDVLVISSAIRRGVSLNEFIQGLPPVPFVRPSIRSFVAQLATGERREFRKQLRTVLTSNAAFHIRRLIAESFAQQVPQDEDWPIIRDLRDRHREVYQVIYTHASLVGWHYFWLSHLVPVLKEMRDVEGIIAHVYRVTIWKNDDAAGVLGFWMEALSLDWLDSNRLTGQLAFSLSGFESVYLPLVTPLLKRLLSMPQPEHSVLGQTVARCIDAGAVDDSLLWHYITGDVSNDEIIDHSFANKLHCDSHEFGDQNDNFLTQRMKQSTVLLDLAVETIEQWSKIQTVYYGETRIGYRHGFLDNTSYHYIHSQSDCRHIGNEQILMGAIETAIIDHAINNSDWWRKNRERLCFNHEGTLCYFGIGAVTTSPQPNIDLITRLLSDKNLLESCLSYELGTLIQTAFTYLNGCSQEAVIAIIQTVWDQSETDEEMHFWILKQRADYISAIPCYLRSVETQAILDAYENTNGTLTRQPSIRMRGGSVTAPFSFEFFLNLTDANIIRLLTHYSRYEPDFDDFLVGGEQEVDDQLREASSRHPSRFLKLLGSSWGSISTGSRDAIMDGISRYLAHRYGNLKIDSTWVPSDEPDASTLANQILAELNNHSSHWRHNRSAARALEACAPVIQNKQSAEQLVFLAEGFVSIKEVASIREDSAELLTTGINITIQNIAEALMILATNLHEFSIALPELLPPTLRQLANNEHRAIRTVILNRLPYLQSLNPELGWSLFNIALQDAAGLWGTAERCLYYAYHNHFKTVEPLLKRIFYEGNKEDMETWGRISALSTLCGHIDLNKLLGELNTLNSTEAWQGAANVWTHTENIRQNREQCLAGIETGLQADGPHAVAVARCVNKIFSLENPPPISIPLTLIQLCFCVFEKISDEKHHRLFHFAEWLNAISQCDPELALSSAEIYLAYVSRTRPYFHDHQNRLVQLVNRLFAEAEEREESDKGSMLQRVVVLQDLLLSLGVDSINEWLKAAERQ